MQALSGTGFAFILSIIINWKLCLALVAFVPVVFLSGVITGRASTNTKNKGRYATEEGGRITTETVDNIKTVVSLGKEEFFMTELAEVFNYKFAKTLAILHVQAFFYSLSNSVLFFIQATTFAFGYVLIQNEGLRVADMFKIYASITVSTLLLSRVYSQLPDQKKSVDAAKRVYRLLERKSKIDSLSEEGLKPDKIVGDIRFTNVVFNYPLRPDMKILRGFNLDVKNGQINALVGPSGNFNYSSM